MTTLAAMRPDLAAEWHPDRNGDLSPSDVMPASNKRVWWRCPRGHEWRSVIASRNRAKAQCPYCIGQRPTADRNLAVLYPAVAAEWHPTRNNGRTPADVTGHSHRQAWWECAAGHQWPAVIASRTAAKDGCPYCAGTRVTEDRNLHVLYPTLAAEWHPTRNGEDRRPCDVLPHSSKKAWWQCPTCGHAWQAVIRSRTRRNTGCPACASSKNKGIPLAARAPELLDEWCVELNAGPGDDVAAASALRAWWRCQKEPTHLWRTAVQNRTRGKSGCPYCAGRRPWAGRNLAVLRPDLAGQWHPTRNGSLSPTDVLPHSSRTCWWHCDQGHEWEARVVNRALGRGCPTCSEIQQG
jgi:hypothetical protein